MNMDAFKRALLKGIPSGIVSWLIYAGVFGMLIDKQPAKTAFFERSTMLASGGISHSESARISQSQSV